MCQNLFQRASVMLRKCLGVKAKKIKRYKQYTDKYDTIIHKYIHITNMHTYIYTLMNVILQDIIGHANYFNNFAFVSKSTLL